jgi:hypothetical protein
MKYIKPSRKCNTHSLLALWSLRRDGRGALYRKTASRLLVLGVAAALAPVRTAFGLPDLLSGIDLAMRVLDGGNPPYDQ